MILMHRLTQKWISPLMTNIAQTYSNWSSSSEIMVSSDLMYFFSLQSCWSTEASSSHWAIKLRTLISSLDVILSAASAWCLLYYFDWISSHPKRSNGFGWFLLSRFIGEITAARSLAPNLDHTRKVKFCWIAGGIEIRQRWWRSECTTKAAQESKTEKKKLLLRCQNKISDTTVKTGTSVCVCYFTGVEQCGTCFRS